jgi:hypothetical protein
LALIWTDLTNGFIQLLAERRAKWHNGVPVMKATKKMPKTSSHPEIFPHVDSMQVAVVLSQYRHIYNRAAGEVVGIF